MKSVTGGVAVPLIAFAVLATGASDASGLDAGQSQSTATPVALMSSSINMAPQPPELSEEEKRAIADKEAGRPFDQRAYNSARQKQIQAEKYNKDRNKQKRRK